MHIYGMDAFQGFMQGFHLGATDPTNKQLPFLATVHSCSCPTNDDIPAPKPASCYSIPQLREMWDAAVEAMQADILRSVGIDPEQETCEVTRLTVTIVDLS